jgi:hypothetical protein
MVVKELPRERALTILASSQSEHVRSPGVHVTDLVKLVMAGIDPAKAKEDYDPTDSQNWQAMGLLWEEVLTNLYAARNLHPGVQNYTYLGRTGEVQMAGVVGSPDGFGMDPDGLCGVESKLTWKSRRGFSLDAPKFIAWKFQILAYGHMAGLTRYYLPVFWVNGTYDRYVPELVEYKVDFTQRECEENWTMLVNTGKRHGLLL